MKFKYTSFKIFLFVNVRLLFAYQESLVQQAHNLGYDVKSYEVVTRDGYILSLYRIHGTKHSHIITQSIPVLLVHAFLYSMNQWLVLPGESAAYKLADAGYDVWLLNLRGTTYSRKHITFSLKDTKYWDFSWHEMGYYDIPATIDFVLEQTQKTKIFYVGHSQGCTILLAGLSTRTEYNSKIALAYFLAPAAYLPITKGTANYVTSETALKTLKSDIVPANLIFSPCQNSMVASFCSNLYAAIVGPFTNHTMAVRSSILTGKYVANVASLKHLTHFVQNWSSEKFQWFDYQKDNVKYYGKHTPPEYNLKLVDVPIAIRVLPDDYVDAGAILKRLIYRIKNVHSVKILSGNHIEFLFNPIINAQVNHDLISTFAAYQNSNELFINPVKSKHDTLTHHEQTNHFEFNSARSMNSIQNFF